MSISKSSNNAKIILSDVLMNSPQNSFWNEFYKILIDFFHMIIVSTCIGHHVLIKLF